jgi:lipopolysaccharide export system protein LptA
MLSSASTAQSIRNHNSNAPVDFSAASMELQDRADRVVLSGGVTAVQAGLTLKASRVTAAYSSSSAIYDLDSSLITLIGNVNLVQGSNRLTGGRLVIDLNSGRSTINGGGVPGATNSGGRVTGSFSVPQRKN